MKFMIFLKRFLKSPIFICSLIYFILIGLLSTYTVNASVAIGVLDQVESPTSRSLVEDLKKKDGYIKYIVFTSADEMQANLKAGKIKTSFTIEDEDGLVFYEKNIVENPLSGIIRDDFYSSYFKIYALNMGVDLVKAYTEPTKYQETYYKYLNGDLVYSFKFFGNSARPNLFPLATLSILGLLAANMAYIYDLLKIRDKSSIALRVSIGARYFPILFLYLVAILFLLAFKSLDLDVLRKFLLMFLGCLILYIFSEKYMDTSSYLLFTTIYILGFIASSGLLISSKATSYVNGAALVYLLANFLKTSLYKKTPLT